MDMDFPTRKESSYCFKQEMIGNFRVDKVLGKGSYGVVKMGTSTLTGEKVAIKTMNPSRLVSDNDRKSLQNEIEIMKKLNHENIVRVFEVIEQNNQVSLIMEYSENGELFDHIIKNHKLKELEACKIFIETIEALEHIHAMGIVHRDVKPENILLGSQNKVKLSDFGLSTLIPSDGTKLKEFCGSPLYSSPELFLQKPYIGPEVDVWALGVTLYAMTTGSIPWKGNSLMEQARNIVKGNYIVPSDVSLTVEILLEKMLQPDPRKRSSLVEIKSIAHDWKSNLEYYQTIQAN